MKKSDYKNWAPNGEYKKVFVVDASVKKTEKELKEKGIEVWSYKDILKKLLEKLKEEQEKIAKEKGPGRIGKEEDTLLRIFSDMLRRGIINEQKLK